MDDELATLSAPFSLRLASAVRQSARPMSSSRKKVVVRRLTGETVPGYLPLAASSPGRAPSRRSIYLISPATSSLFFSRTSSTFATSATSTSTMLLTPSVSRAAPSSPAPAARGSGSALPSVSHLRLHHRRRPPPLTSLRAWLRSTHRCSTIWSAMQDSNSFPPTLAPTPSGSMSHEPPSPSCSSSLSSPRPHVRSLYPPPQHRACKMSFSKLLSRPISVPTEFINICNMSDLHEIVQSFAPASNPQSYRIVVAALQSEP